MILAVRTVSALLVAVLALIGIHPAGSVAQPAVTNPVITAQEETCAATTGGGSASMDLVFALDASGSMSSNDRSRLRVTAAQGLVDAIIPGDRVAAVDFNSGARTMIDLSDDREAVKAALATARQSGGTNIGAGVTRGLDILADGSDASRSQYIILLTDGYGSYSSSITQRAVAAGVVVHTVALGSSSDERLLTAIADSTGGEFLKSATANDLIAVFENLRDITIRNPCELGLSLAEEYEVAEGGTVTIDANFGEDTDPSDLIVGWDFDADGVFTDEFGPSIEFSALGLDGPAVSEVSVKACDDAGTCETSTTAINILNVAPSVSPILSRYAVVGHELNLQSTWFDPAGGLDAPYDVKWSWQSESHSVAGLAHGTVYTANEVGESKHSVTVTDKDGAGAEVDFAVTGVMMPLTCAAAVPSETTIWPPNHKFVDIGITPPVQADGTEVTVVPVYVHQDEALDAEGSGNTDPDAKISNGKVEVRAERAGTQDGRVYTIGYRAVAADGRDCIGEVQVGVPHSKNKTAVESYGLRFDSITGEILEHTAGDSEVPTENLPASLERSSVTVTATVAQGEATELLISVHNATEDDVVGVLGDGPLLGTISDLSGFECQPWGDGSTCTATGTYTAGTTDFGIDKFSLAVVADGVAWDIPVEVAVGAVNAAPHLVASPASIVMREGDDPVRLRVIGWDAETGVTELVYRVATAPENGTLSAAGSVLTPGTVFTADAELLFAPSPGFSGPDSIVLSVTDLGKADEAPLTTEVTIPIMVRAVPKAPQVEALSLEVAEDSSVTAELLITDPDSASEDLLGEVTVPAANGTAIAGEIPCVGLNQGSECALSISYTPTSDFDGVDEFTITVTDGLHKTDVTVPVLVTEVNDPPVMSALERAVDAGGTLTIGRDELLSYANAGAANEQSQTLTFVIASSEADISVTEGLTRWHIGADSEASGDYALVVTVCDDGTTAGVADFKCDSSTLTISVETRNNPPTANPVEVDTEQGQPVPVDIVASDADGDELTFELAGTVSDATVELGVPICETLGGASECTVTALITPAAHFAGTLEFAVHATDGIDSISIPVTVVVNPAVGPPTLTAPSNVTVDEDSSTDIAVVAVGGKQDGSDPAIRVTRAPSNGAIRVNGSVVAEGDSLAGPALSFVYAPDPDYAGKDSFAVVAIDSAGAESAPVEVAITVDEINDRPSAVSRTVSITAGESVLVTSSTLLEGAFPGPSNEASQILAVSDFTLEDNAPATVTNVGNGFNVNVSATATENFTASFQVCDDGTSRGVADPQCVDAQVTFKVSASSPDLSAPVIILSSAVIADGSDAVITVETYDASGPVEVTATVEGEPVEVVNGYLHYTPSGPGHYTVVVTATDAFGNSATAKTSILVLGEDDGVAPDISLDSPGDGATITGSTAVLGSVNDDALSHWAVTLTPTNTSAAEAIVVGEGAAAVNSGALGTIDPTTLPGGQYVLQLEATDKGGRISRIVRRVFLDPRGKYGVFSMTFTDAVVQVAGVPLTVQRTYHSAARLQAKEFGQGWALSVNSLRLERDTPAGEAWIRENHGSFLPNYVLVPTASHTVTVVDGTADSMVFDFTPTFVNPISDGRFATASWTERTTTGAKLEPLDTTELVLTGDVLVSLDDAGLYDPDAYRLTMPDGRVFDFALSSGLTRITDAAGNTVTISDTAIESSTGAAITLRRDREGRITSIATPAGAQTTYEYDQGGNLVGVTDPSGHTTSYAYDGAHLLTGIVDALGRIPSRQEYDDNGRLIAVIDADGNRTEIESDPESQSTAITDRLGNTTVQQFNADGYLVAQVFADGSTESYVVDERGNRLKRTDGEGNTWTATYDQRGNRTSVTDPLGKTRSFTYEEHGWLTSATNELGEKTSVTHDTRGNVTMVTFPDASTVKYTYDAAGNTLTESDETGRTWVYTYDDQGRRITAASPGGEVTTYAYDGDGRLTSTQAPEGGATATTYDARGLATESANALGGVTSVTFDEAGQRTATQYPTGVSTTMQYDAIGRVSSVTTAGATTSYTYDLEGRVTRVETPSGLIRETGYDAAGRVVTVKENGQVVSTITYDAAGRAKSRTDALGGTSTYTYDAAGRLTDTVRPDGTTVSTTYDAAGRPLSVTSPAGTATYVYDIRGRIESQTSPGETAVDYTYDAAGRVLTIKNASGTTSFTYDADGRLESATDANGGSTSVGYDGDGRRVSVVDAKGRSRMWVYDAAGNLLTFDVAGVRQLTQEFDTAGRIISRSIGQNAPTTYLYNDAGRLESVNAPGTAAVTYGYNAHGLRTSVSDSRGETTYEYDDRSRLTVIDAPEGAISYTYDAASRVAKIVTEAGTTSYSRNERGLIAEITDPAGGLYVLDRDGAGRVESIKFPNGVVESYEFDTAGRVLAVTLSEGGTELASFEVTRDQAGRIATFLDALDGETRSGSFDYDAGGRLIGIEETDGPQSWSSTFTLDAAGNRETVTGDGATTAKFNDLDQVVSSGDRSYSYDESGFLASVADSAGTTNLTWSTGGELLGFDAPGVDVVYEYDAAGVLVSRTDSAGKVGFVNDSSMSLPHAVAASDGSWWVYAGARPLAQASPDGRVYYLHADVRGDVRVVTDAAAAVTDSFTYSVDGLVTERIGSTAVTVGWNGEYTDSDTGLVWLRARWYDPSSARFLSADPWHGNPSVPVSLNRYLFGNADPVNNADPTGLYTMLDLEVSMELRLEINSISTGYYLGLLSSLRTALKVVAIANGALFGGGAAYWAVTAQAGDPNDQEGIDGPGPVPGVGVGEGPDESPKTQVGGNGSNGGSNPPTVTTTTFCSDGTRIEPEDWNDHIYPRHVDPNSYPQKSKFFDTEDLLRLLCDLAGSSPLDFGVAKSNSLNVRVYDAGQPIGMTSGAPTSFVTVFTRANGSVVTAHPGLPDMTSITWSIGWR